MPRRDTESRKATRRARYRQARAEGFTAKQAGKLRSLKVFPRVVGPTKDIKISEVFRGAEPTAKLGRLSRSIVDLSEAIIRDKKRHNRIDLVNTGGQHQWTVPPLDDLIPEVRDRVEAMPVGDEDIYDVLDTSISALPVADDE